jgi:hypothetical protein
MILRNPEIMCTANNCPESKRCYRHTKGNPDSIEQCSCDLSIQGCDPINGYDYYILLHNT